ncbi:DUF2357 domain-containing protein [Beggiatoa alba]|nr:DUF2357 domain-containing protein [Beggiatoa alba]
MPPYTFQTEQGETLNAPREWQACLLVLAESFDDNTRVSLQHHPLKLSQERLQGVWRLVAKLPRLNTGHYQLIINQENYSFSVQSEKLSTADIELLLLDLIQTLPASIAQSLQRTNAFSGSKNHPHTQTTLTGEINRLHNALFGTTRYRGLCQLLPALQHAPHQQIHVENRWRPVQCARRPAPAQLASALRPHNLDAQQKIKRVLEPISALSVDVYENRLLKIYLAQIRQLLNRLRILKRCQTTIEQYSQALTHAERQAPFLKSVSDLTHLPQQETMILQHVPLYRALMMNYRAFQAEKGVSLQHEALASPLENLPTLYQLWGTLQVLQALLIIAETKGYEVIQQTLCVPDGVGWLVRVLPNGQAACVLKHPEYQTVVRFIPERTYQGSFFQQRPDIAIEVETEQGELAVYIFDPKYKLDSQQDKPQKGDIDKMHAYRDAIRHAGKPVVRYAAILYPAENYQITAEIAAIQAIPNQASELQALLQEKLKMIV